MRKWMFSLLVLFIVVVRNEVLSSSSSSPRVAVCISGQVGRMIPEYFVDGLLTANPSFRFHLFFNLAISKVLYTTFNVIQDTKYQNMTKKEITFDLHELFGKIPNTEMANVAYDRLFTRMEWTNMTGLKKFDIFHQFKKSGYVMLNMYKHHEDCGNQIVQQELLNGFKFDYVISTREDIYFFKPLNLNALISKHMTKRNRACDLLTKGCLDFGGLNMRLQFFRRGNDAEIRYMSKVSYFKKMMMKRKIRKFQNPEMFEQHIAEKRLNMTVCKLDVEEFPVTAARLSYINLTVCFIHQELKLFERKSPPCVPKSDMDFAIMHLCPRVKTRYEFVPWQNFTFIPNSAFPRATKSYHRKFQGELNSMKTLQE